MFGKTKEMTETEERQAADVFIDDFFGDEAAVEEAVRIDQLFQRVSGIEQQINSQFTSMAAYAQIAQEQIELVRSESQHSTERSEQRIIGLIERERSDRMAADGGSAPNVTARLDSLEAQLGELRESLQQCLSNQKALAEAITDLFTPTEASGAAPAAPIAATPVVPAPSTFAVDAVEIDRPLLSAPITSTRTSPSTTHIDDTADGDAIDDVVVIEPAEAFDSFDVFAAPDIATIEPMTSLPAPVLHGDHPAPPAHFTPDAFDGPIAGLSLS